MHKIKASVVVCCLEGRMVEWSLSSHDWRRCVKTSKTGALSGVDAAIFSNVAIKEILIY